MVQCLYLQLYLVISGKAHNDEFNIKKLHRVDFKCNIASPCMIKLQ